MPKDKFWKVVDQCYLCDVCYMTKCPYVPPHQWNLDFPHTMLRAKAIQYKTGKMKFRDKLLTSTELVGTLSSIPVVVHAVNAANKYGPARAVLQQVLGVQKERQLPEFDAANFRDADHDEQLLLIEWKLYSVELNRIEKQPGFPDDITWPIAPGTAVAN